MIRTAIKLALVIAGLAAAPALAQSGNMTVFEPVTPVQAIAGRPLLKGKDAQAALNTNVARVLAPDFVLDGDVSIRDEAVRPGPLFPVGLQVVNLPVQTVLSVPVRFRHTATLDRAFAFAYVRMPPGTRLYRQFMPQAPGAMTGYEQWCGVDAVSLPDNSTPGIVCFGRRPDGSAALYSPDGAYYAKPYYATPYTFRPEDIPPLSDYSPPSLDDYRGPFPAMTPEAKAPAGMMAELQVTHFRNSDSFTWVLKSGDDEVELGYLGTRTEKVLRQEGDRSVLRLGWLDLVFSASGRRLTYDGLVDLTAGDADLASRASLFDSQSDGAPAQPANAWRLGALDIDRDSLTTDAVNGDVQIRLKARLRSKVRLLDGTPPGRLPQSGELIPHVGNYAVGEVFYATVLDRYYQNGQPYMEDGWCGTVHKIPEWGRDMLPKYQTCFSPDDDFTTILSNDALTWESRGASPLIFGGKFPADLPRHEAVAMAAEDARDITMRIYRDRERDEKDGYVFITLSVRDAAGEREQRTWYSPFDGTGKAVFILWTKRLVITRDGAHGVKVTIDDLGDGLGARFVR